MTDRDSAAGLEQIARLLLNHGQHEQAAKLLAAAADLDPTSSSILRLRALAAYKLGQFREALGYSRAAMGGATPSGQRAISVLQAFSLAALGQRADARSTFRDIEPVAAPTPPSITAASIFGDGRDDGSTDIAGDDDTRPAPGGRTS